VVCFCEGEEERKVCEGELSDFTGATFYFHIRCKEVETLTLKAMDFCHFGNIAWFNDAWHVPSQKI
jgi:hypothetical protein